MSDCLDPHRLQHARLFCPPLSPRICSNSYSSSWWVTLCNHLILCSLFFSCPQSFPASEFFPVSWLFPSGGQNIGALASASVLPMSIQGWLPLRLTCLIFFFPKGLSRVFSRNTIWKHQFFSAYGPTLTSIHDYCRNHGFDYMGLYQQSDVSGF